MIGKLFLLGRACLLVACLLGASAYSQQQPVLAAAAVDAGTKQQILSATVRIVFYALPLDENGRPQQPVMEEGPAIQRLPLASRDGLGTVVKLNGETVIVTHDHWVFQERLKLARFYDASGKLFGQVYGDEFAELIRYRDGGTMILALPSPEAVPASAEINRQQLRPDDVVWLAYRPPDSAQLTVLPLQVTDVHDQHDPRRFALVSPEGMVIEKGNSGGGVWYEGRLVGNLWSTVHTRYVFADQGSLLVSTERSVAAWLPIEQIVQTERRTLGSPALPETEPTS